MIVWVPGLTLLKVQGVIWDWLPSRTAVACEGEVVTEMLP
jgi:hypothetical protein